MVSWMGFLTGLVVGAILTYGALLISFRETLEDR